jgi:hypothetical protein
LNDLTTLQKRGAADMHTIRRAHAFGGRPSLPDAATEVAHQIHIVGVERRLGLTRLGA